MTKKLKIKNTNSEVKKTAYAGPTKQAYRFSAISMIDFAEGPLDLEALTNDPRSIGCRVELLPDGKLALILRSINGDGIPALPLVISGDLVDRLELEGAGQVDEFVNIWDYVYIVKDSKLAAGKIHLKDFPEVYIETTNSNTIKAGEKEELEIHPGKICLSEESAKEKRRSLEEYKDFGLRVKKHAKTKKEGEERYASILSYVVRKLAKLNNYTYPLDSQEY
jgi:hypothetical protein